MVRRGKVAHRHDRQRVVRSEHDQRLETNVAAGVQDETVALFLRNEPTDPLFKIEGRDDRPPHRLGGFALQDALAVEFTVIQVGDGPTTHVFDT